ncbi:hypothetical protein MAPG_04207 [Magnaporthiopsis poae ATCC 64411]|uniref:Uncharacterized protein n=1 Tax=Magnaporthiopsis poae (strain ATCC 64411 / 73-15) TaxID=644358 RepID=A0A0C4DW36_MAGP6|nr:hypothetical protein MAPG_04207 [Magnaporthiopsis poae ATCC 64411]
MSGWLEGQRGSSYDRVLLSKPPPCSATERIRDTVFGSQVFRRIARSELSRREVGSGGDGMMWLALLKSLGLFRPPGTASLTVAANSRSPCPSKSPAEELARIITPAAANSPRVVPAAEARGGAASMPRSQLKPRLGGGLEGGMEDQGVKLSTSNKTSYSSACSAGELQQATNQASGPDQSQQGSFVSIIVQCGRLCRGSNAEGRLRSAQPEQREL